MDSQIWILTVALLGFALAFAHWGTRCFAWLDGSLQFLAARQHLTLLLVAAFSFGLSVTLSLGVRMPQPGIHDEFSYLLAADTFARGRLTNPPHPLWVHFESMHIIQQPTYASKYPPAQGLMLAAGQMLSGHPIVGVWLSTALAGAALCWMFFAWLPPRWAVFAGFLGAIHPLALTWSQCYWGGAVAACGGALALGAFRRIVSAPKARDALWLGIGLAVLANSRPYEGFVLGLALASGFAVWLLRGPRPQLTVLLQRLVVPTSAVLLLAGVWMGYYNFRVTGNPLKMPYAIHEGAYCITPIFLWQKPKPEPAYRHQAIRDFQTGWAFDFYRRQQTPRGLLFDELRKVNTLCKWYFWYYVFLLPLPVVVGTFRKDRWLQATLWFCAAFVTSLLPLTWTLQPHYAAPVLGLFLLLSVQTLRHLWHGEWPGPAVGRYVVRALALFCAGTLLLFGVYHARHGEGNDARARMIENLAKQGGQHLIVVRYSPKHSPHDEWVYNEADIDQARVVWAREMGADENRKLLDYFHNRKVWLLEPDRKPVRLVPYPR